MLSSIVRSGSCWWTKKDRKSYLLKPYTGLQHKLDELQFISTLENKIRLYNTNTETLNFVFKLAVCIMKSPINPLIACSRLQGPVYMEKTCSW